jgi:hypothetical protein
MSSLEVLLSWGAGGVKRLSTDEAGEGAFCSEWLESARWGVRRYLLGEDFGVVSNDVKERSGMLEDKFMNVSFPGLNGGVFVVRSAEEVVEVDEVLLWPFCVVWGTFEEVEMVRDSCLSWGVVWKA